MTKEIGDSTLIDTWGATGTKIEPDLSKKNQGWTLGEFPPFEFMNWIQNVFGKKINHLLSRGVADWNSTTSYEIGATVNHTGSLWVALADNDASEPTGPNTNWSEVVTASETEQRIGVDQDWVEYTGTGLRIAGTAYQNTTGRPIQVVVCLGQTVSRRFEISSDGVTYIEMFVNAGGAPTTGSIVVPDNYYYRAIGGFSNWSELR